MLPASFRAEVIEAVIAGKPVPDGAGGVAGAGGRSGATGRRTTEQGGGARLTGPGHGHESIPTSDQRSPHVDRCRRGKHSRSMNERTTPPDADVAGQDRSEEHTSELQSHA